MTAIINSLCLELACRSSLTNLTAQSVHSSEVGQGFINLTSLAFLQQYSNMLLTTANFVTRRRENKPKDISAASKMTTGSSSSSDRNMFTLKPKTEENFFQFPEVTIKEKSDSLCTSGYGSLENCSLTPCYPSVTIDTPEFCLCVDTFAYDVTLRQRTGSTPAPTCVFRQVTIDTENVRNGTKQTCVFYLNNNEQHFLTTTADGKLEINMFPGELPPRESEPDERFFTVFTTLAGQTLIQPALHKGKYLHHLDNVLAVRTLDLNWRAPEEYFFSISTIETVEQESRIPSIESSGSQSVASNKRTKTIEEEPERKSVKVLAVKPIELPTKQLPRKTKLKMADIFFGCFSDRSKRLVN